MLRHQTGCRITNAPHLQEIVARTSCARAIRCTALPIAHVEHRLTLDKTRHQRLIGADVASRECDVMRPANTRLEIPDSSKVHFASRL